MGISGGNAFLDHIFIDYYVFAITFLAKYFPYAQILLAAFLYKYSIYTRSESFFFVTGSFAIVGGTFHGLLWSDTSDGWKFLYYLMGFVAVAVYPAGIALIFGVIFCFPVFVRRLWKRSRLGEGGAGLGPLGWLHHLFVHHPAEAPIRRAQSGAIVRQPIDGAELAAAMDRGWLHRLKATFTYRSQARRAERVAEQLDAERELLDAERKIAEAAIERERARQRLDLTRRQGP